MGKRTDGKLVAYPRVAFHRNGIGGAGFHVVRFEGAAGSDVDGRAFVATVFEEEGHVAVLSLDHAHDDARLLDDAYRGDHFEAELRVAVAEFGAAQDRKLGLAPAVKPRAKRTLVEAAVIRVLRETGPTPDEDLLEAVTHFEEASDGDVCAATSRLFRDGVITRATTDEPWRLA